MDLQTKLNEEGMRMTRPRQVVLSILENANVPLSPQTIHQQSLDAQQEIGLVSVYRTLDILTDLALVRKVHTPDGCHGYVDGLPRPPSPPDLPGMRPGRGIQRRRRPFQSDEPHPKGDRLQY